MTFIDKEKLSQLFTQLNDAKQRLTESSNLSKEEFLNDRRAIDAAKYNFIVAIEVIIDVCNHIISKKILGKPESYSDIFLIMKDANIFNDELTKNLKNMVKFRNLLVHLYWKVDNNLLYEFLQNNLKDFELFENTIRNYLSQEKE